MSGKTQHALEKWLVNCGHSIGRRRTVVTRWHLFVNFLLLIGLHLTLSKCKKEKDGTEITDEDRETEQLRMIS